MKTFLLKYFPILRILFYIIFTLYFALMSLPPTESNNTICTIYTSTGLLCPTCGVTRAWIHFLHGNFNLAFTYNPIFTVAIFPICIFIFSQDIYNYIKRIFLKKENYSLLEYLYVVIIK